MQKENNITFSLQTVYLRFYESEKSPKMRAGAHSFDNLIIINIMTSNNELIKVVKVRLRKKTRP